MFNVAQSINAPAVHGVARVLRLEAGVATALQLVSKEIIAVDGMLSHCPWVNYDDEVLYANVAERVIVTGVLMQAQPWWRQVNDELHFKLNDTQLVFTHAGELKISTAKTQLTLTATGDVKWHAGHDIILQSDHHIHLNSPEPVA